MQLKEHAQAILADDAALGIKRCDPVLEKIAAGGARNADTWTTNQNTIRYPKIPELSFYLVVASLCKARAAFGASGDQDMQAPIAISRVQVGSTAKHPLIKPSDFVKGLDQARKLKVIMPHPDLDKCKKTLVEFWKRWKLQYGADHQIFAEVAEKDLALTLPVRLHGDEGRRILA